MEHSGVQAPTFWEMALWGFEPGPSRAVGGDSPCGSAELVPVLLPCMWVPASPVAKSICRPIGVNEHQPRLSGILTGILTGVTLNPTSARFLASPHGVELHSFSQGNPSLCLRGGAQGLGTPGTHPRLLCPEAWMMAQ